MPHMNGSKEPPTHTIMVTIPEDLLCRLDQRARESADGDRAAFVRTVLERELADTSHPGMSFRELLAPIHDEVRLSGMSESELNQLLEEAREAAYQEWVALHGDR